MWSGKPDARNPEKRRDDGRWLGTEWSEGRCVKEGDLGGNRTAFMVPDKDEEPPPRSQSTHSSVEAG